MWYIYNTEGGIVATIMNKKAHPITQEEVKRDFSGGVEVHDCDRGVCLISKRGEPNTRWWADFSDLLGEVTRREGCRTLANPINTQLFDLPWTLYLSG